MRFRVAASVLASLTLTIPLVGQEATSACAKPREPSIAQLQALTRQYHPEALSAAKRGKFAIVAFVFDANCRVVRHTLSGRGGERIDLDATLASLFPGPWHFQTAGIADADARKEQGRPWVIWAVKA
jgi:hypothetical protein